MHNLPNMARQVLESRIGIQLDDLAAKYYSKKFKDCTDSECYNCLLQMTKMLMETSDAIVGEKKLYYISAEFLIGKLLSNNLINLGIYDKVSEILKEQGKDLARIEGSEPEPSLGNGGLGRLASCFLDSIATLGLPGDGIGLCYHFGLFSHYHI